MRKPGIEVILTHLNDHDPTRINGRLGQATRDLRNHFRPFVVAYRELVGYGGEGLRNTQNLFAYMADTMETNLLGE